MDGSNLNSTHNTGFTWRGGPNGGQWTEGQNGGWMQGFGYSGGMLHDAADLIAGNFAHQYTAFPPSPPPLANDVLRPPQDGLPIRESTPRLLIQQTAVSRPRTYALPQQSPPRTPMPASADPWPTSAEVLQLSPHTTARLNKKRSRESVEPASEGSEPEVVAVSKSHGHYGHSGGGKENKAKHIKPKSASKKAKVQTVVSDHESDAEDRTGKQWTVAELNLLVEATLGPAVSDEKFARFMAKNAHSWQKISLELFKGTRSREACYNQFRRMRGLWTAVKAFFEFTGGNGDGDSDDDDRESDSYLERRLELVKNAKHDGNVDKLTPRIIRQWEEGRDWLELFQRRFGKNPAVVRTTHCHSGRLSPPPGTSRRKAADSGANSGDDSESADESEAVVDALNTGTLRKATSSQAAAPRSKKGGVPEPPYTPKTPAAAMSHSFESIGRFVDMQREMAKLHKQEQKFKLAMMVLESPSSTEEQKAKARAVIDKLTDVLGSL